MTSKIKQGMHLRQPESSSDGGWVLRMLAAMLACGALLILAIFPGIAYWAANLLGFMSPINFVYVVIIFLLLAKQFFMSIKLSQLDSKVRILTEQVALNEEKVERDKLDL